MYSYTAQHKILRLNDVCDACTVSSAARRQDRHGQPESEPGDHVCFAGTMRGDRTCVGTPMRYMTLHTRDTNAAHCTLYIDADCVQRLRPPPPPRALPPATEHYCTGFPNTFSRLEFSLINAAAILSGSTRATLLR